MMLLPKEFYLQTDVVELSRQLIGKVLCTRIEENFCAGVIVETEAYAGEVDKASHAYGGRRTQRTEVMYHEGGVSYVYLCYGIHYLFNVVTHAADVPEAILIRGIVPLDGIPLMKKRRGLKSWNAESCIGPGKVSKALGINLTHNKLSLNEDTIFIEDRGIEIDPTKIQSGPRIGIDYAEEDALLPYRFQYTDYRNLFESLK